MSQKEHVLEDKTCIKDVFGFAGNHKAKFEVMSNQSKERRIFCKLGKYMSDYCENRVFYKWMQRDPNPQPLSLLTNT